MLEEPVGRAGGLSDAEKRKASGDTHTSGCAVSVWEDKRDHPAECEGDGPGGSWFGSS